MEDLEYIKKFSKISIKKVCDLAKVDKANLYSGKTKKDKVKKVRNYIESEVAQLYLMNEKEKKEDEKIQI